MPDCLEQSSENSSLSLITVTTNCICFNIADISVIKEVSYLFTKSLNTVE